MEEELNDKGNGGDFYDDGEDVRDFDNTIREVKLERSHDLLGNYGIEQDNEVDMNYALIHVGYTMEPDEVKVPKELDDWFDTAPKKSEGGTTFGKVDNPGGWIIFSYRPLFASGAQGGKYKANYLPYGCHPVPPNEDDYSIRAHGGWIFFYQGWKKG